MLITFPCDIHFIYTVAAAAKQGSSSIIHDVKLVKISGTILSICINPGTGNLVIGSDEGYVSISLYHLLFSLSLFVSTYQLVIFFKWNAAAMCIILSCMNTSKLEFSAHEKATNFGLIN